MERNRRNRIALTVSTTITLILTLLGVMQLTKTTHFLLPVSSFFPTMAILLPSMTLFCLIIPIASPSVFAARRLFYPAALIVIIFTATILLGLLSPYISPNLSHCIHDALWSRLFGEKSLKIERIENVLRCCGFNTPYDRAYPFPSSSAGANACVLEYKYTESCAYKWQHETKIVAEWCVVSFSIILLAGIGGLLHTILVYKRQSTQVSRDPRSSQSSKNAVIVKGRGAPSERSVLLEQPAPVNPTPSSLLDLEAHDAT
ncbi:hypothetical protein POJ06DRAFT_57738 [Lipomyces tetrasporus]|uniref:Tetraspanin Tsp3 n=1 Tax=Lipomyces tetrasporus TaxID=54092 RepID=A0AAD7VU85_9ASCO|nr:uncharacterized protein POJ06DRAFT_57738 [Lipomyces tetrasporus]KAJ8102862.1 hypothetical protein POJ06DRAFT_57738 [Lipomyces tetrasporus]